MQDLTSLWNFTEWDAAEKNVDLTKHYIIPDLPNVSAGLVASSKFRTLTPFIGSLIFHAVPSFIPMWMTLVCIWWHNLMWWGRPLVMFRVKLITAISVVSCLAPGPVWVRMRWGDGVRTVKRTQRRAQLWPRLCEWWASDFTWLSWLLNILLFFLKTVFLTWLWS